MTEPATHAMRYRIWAFASPKGWDCTISEIAEALDVSPNLARATLQHAGWTQRIRLVGQSDFDRTGWHMMGTRAAARYTAADIIAGRVGVDG